MNDLESAVARHYGGTDLMAKILAGIEASGADLDHLRPEDLAPVDEFHIGGRKATAYAMAKMSLDSSAHVLDIGCGIGGTARFMAVEYGCRVTGIDLTPEYIAVARKLTALTGLEERVDYETASALAIPRADGSFDGAVTIHVAMNISDRAALYGEVARNLKPGASFCIYDVMKKNGDELAYPVPWAETAQTSHLTTPEETGELLRGAGFEVVETEDRTEFALEFFTASLAAMAGGASPLGLHLLMGANAPEKFKNMVLNIESGRIAPVVMIARR